MKYIKNENTAIIMNEYRSRGITVATILYLLGIP